MEFSQSSNLQFGEEKKWYVGGPRLRYKEEGEEIMEWPYDAYL